MSHDEGLWLQDTSRNQRWWIGSYYSKKGTSSKTTILYSSSQEQWGVKLAHFYFSVVDMPQYLTASVHNNFLLISMKSEDFRMAKPNAILKHVVDELLLLWEHGIQIDIGHETIVFKVALAQILGDNLGMHTVLGFSECFTANFPRRRCKMPRHACQSSINVNLILLLKKCMQVILPLTNCLKPV